MSNQTTAVAKQTATQAEKKPQATIESLLTGEGFAAR